MTDKSKVKDEAVERKEPETAAEAVEDPGTETVPGGRYLLNGKLVNANGEPIKDGK